MIKYKVVVAFFYMNRLVTILFCCALLFTLVGCSLPLSLHQSSDSYTTEYKATKPRSPSPETHLSINMLNPEQIISAEVLLVSATGIAIDENTPITSKNIKNYLPAPETIRIVSQYFRNQGFEVTPPVGISFTISASTQHFCDFFNTSLVADETNGIRAVLAGEKTSSELPLDSLEESIANLVVTITFVPPPDFGPTNFSF